MNWTGSVHGGTLNRTGSIRGDTMNWTGSTEARRQNCAPVCCRDRSPSWHDWDRGTVGTVRERSRRLCTPLPAATLRSTGRSACSSLPAPRVGSHEPRPAPQLAHQTVHRYCSALRAAESELGEREGQASAHRAASSRQANGHASVRMYAPYFGRVDGTITALGSFSRGWKKNWFFTYLIALWQQTKLQGRIEILIKVTSHIVQQESQTIHENCLQE
jgi:hypothetical protein